MSVGRCSSVARTGTVAPAPGGADELSREGLRGAVSRTAEGNATEGRRISRALPARSGHDGAERARRRPRHGRADAIVPGGALRLSGCGTDRVSTTGHGAEPLASGNHERGAGLSGSPTVDARRAIPAAIRRANGEALACRAQIPGGRTRAAALSGGLRRTEGLAGRDRKQFAFLDVTQQLAIPHRTEALQHRIQIDMLRSSLNAVHTHARSQRIAVGCGRGREGDPRKCSRGGYELEDGKHGESVVSGSRCDELRRRNHGDRGSHSTRCHRAFASTSTDSSPRPSRETNVHSRFTFFIDVTVSLEEKDGSERGGLNESIASDLHHTRHDRLWTAHCQASLLRHSRGLP